MKMSINGKAVEASNCHTIEVINPATNAVLDTIPDATEEDVKFAVKTAKNAQKKWVKVPIYQRVEIIRRFMTDVKDNSEELAHTLSDETGKPITEARGEISNMLVGFDSFCEKAKHLYGDIVPAGQEAGGDNAIVITKREPVGVVACVIPFNFPCNLYAHKIPAALLAGNAAIVKPATDNPLTLCKLTHMLVNAGVSDGALQIITGRGSTVGNWLCGNTDIDLITLTGSTSVGIETAKKAASTLTPYALELGGNDAFIVLQDADIDYAVEQMVVGRFTNSGQICCASKRLLIQNSILEEFTTKALNAISSLKCGLPSEDDTQIGCLINEKAAIEVEEQVELTLKQGGRLLLGGKRKGAFFEPTLIDNISKDADIARDMEVFGPVAAIIPFDTIEEAITIANSSKYGLSGSLFTSNIKKALNIVNSVETGNIIINGSGFYRSFEMPFGGYKYSGIGTEGAMTTFKEMTKIKNIVLFNLLEL